MKPICAVTLANKLHAARIGTPETRCFADQIANDPRLQEALWFVQWVSWQPGGLDAFTNLLIENHPGHFQTPSMRKAGKPLNGRYSMEQCLAAWHQDDPRGGESFLDGELYDETLFADEVNPDKVSYHDFIACFLQHSTREEDADGNGKQATALRRGYERFNFDFLSRRARDLARNGLAQFLVAIIESPARIVSNPKHCHNLIGLLLAELDRHAQFHAGELAETVVSRTVQRELEFARIDGVPMPIVGSSRFGKTKTISHYCQCHPGRARLVVTPNDNSEMAFMRAHATAYGIEWDSHTRLGPLRDKVEFVVRESGLMPIYDEAHALVPVSYTPKTAPRRLNWVRSKIVDQGVPCAFFATPQSSMDTLEQYAKTTGYNLSQWVGRMAPPLVLAESIPFEEIVSVARIQFPDLDDVLLEELADDAILSKSYLKHIELAGRRARFLAREQGRIKPTAEDVCEASAWASGAALQVVEDAGPMIEARKSRKAAKMGSNRAPATKPQSPCTRAAAPLPAPSREDFPRRSTNPIELVQEPATGG